MAHFLKTARQKYGAIFREFINQSNNFHKKRFKKCGNGRTTTTDPSFESQRLPISGRTFNASFNTTDNVAESAF